MVLEKVTDSASQSPSCHETLSKRRVLQDRTEAILHRQDVTLDDTVQRIEDMLSSRENTTIEGIDGSVHMLPPHISRSRWEVLGKLVVEKESSDMNHVDGRLWISLRLDGNGFSKKVLAMRRNGLVASSGYPDRMAMVMRTCMTKLMNKMAAKVGFTFSDEIIILIPPTQIVDGKHRPHYHNGRVQKLITLASGLVSSAFALGMAQELCVNDDTRENVSQVLESLLELAPSFDCRLGIYESWQEARGLLLWRAYNCSINGVSDAVHYCEEQPVDLRMNTIEKLRWLQERGLLPMPKGQAYGTLMVRKKKLKVVDQPVLELIRRGEILVAI